ncbi:MAG: rod shape-determining protein MreC [Magnetococcales bacterium]|nr:rod shape-determining protein MreC [Magnetococcales bacterium]NGZ25341.1 rod shape-determining protein MreC [Magnetococcales bacterium]
MLQLIHLFKLHRNGFLAILLLIAALALLFSVRAGKQSLVIFNQMVLDGVSFVQQVVHSPMLVYQDAQGRLTELLRLEEDNRRLRAELARLTPKLTLLEEIKLENRRLRSMLAMGDDPIYRNIGARVIGSSSSAFSRVMILDVGSEKGVKLDMPVLSAKGLVGRIVEVGRHSSVALSLMDPNSRVPSMVQRSRVQAIAAGRNNTFLTLEYVATGSDVRNGDAIITSGLGGIFPKGLPVGRITSVQPHGVDLFQKVTIRSAVDFDRLEEVNILLPQYSKEL